MTSHIILREFILAFAFHLHPHLKDEFAIHTAETTTTACVPLLEEWVTCSLLAFTAYRKVGKFPGDTLVLSHTVHRKKVMHPRPALNIPETNKIGYVCRVCSPLTLTGNDELTLHTTTTTAVVAPPCTSPLEI